MQLQQESQIKNSIEVLELFAVIVKHFYKEFKGDGLQKADVIKIALTSEFRSKLSAAFKDANQIPGEWSQAGEGQFSELRDYALYLAGEIATEVAAAR